MHRVSERESEEGSKEKKETEKVRRSRKKETDRKEKMGFWDHDCKISVQKKSGEERR